MSIGASIVSLEASGRLRRHSPFRGIAKRRLYLAQTAYKELDNSQSAICTLVGRGNIEYSFDWWTIGKRLYGTTERGTFLDRLCQPPPEVWEIRVTEPTVRARAFGRFAEKDTLIITHIHTRGMLGKKGSTQWNNVMTACVNEWDGMFPYHPPHSGSAISDYVTENYDDFPLC